MAIGKGSFDKDKDKDVEATAPEEVTPKRAAADDEPNPPAAPDLPPDSEDKATAPGTVRGIAPDKVPPELPE